jgi:hypothetical protein
MFCIPFPSVSPQQFYFYWYGVNCFPFGGCSNCQPAKKPKIEKRKYKNSKILIKTQIPVNLLKFNFSQLKFEWNKKMKCVSGSHNVTAHNVTAEQHTETQRQQSITQHSREHRTPSTEHRSLSTAHTHSTQHTTSQHSVKLLPFRFPGFFFILHFCFC